MKMLPMLLALLVSLSASQKTTIKKPGFSLKRPQFDGTSYLGLTNLQDAKRIFRFSLTFRPNSSEGLLLFSAETTKADKDFFSIVLKDGYVVFRFDCGSGLAELKTASKVNLNVWNELEISRSGKTGKLQLNGKEAVLGVTQGNQEEMTFNLNLYVGGYQFVSLISSRIDTKRNFVGCIDELLINGTKVDFAKYGSSPHGQSELALNVEECKYCYTCFNGGTCEVKSDVRSVCVCPYGFRGAACEIYWKKNVTNYMPEFTGKSFWRFDSLKEKQTHYTDIEIVFKPNSADGLLLYYGLFHNRGKVFISLALRDDFLEFKFDLGSGPAILRSLKRLAQGHWHIARASRTGKMGIFQVDNQAPVTGQSNGSITELSGVDALYIGGYPASKRSKLPIKFTKNFTGCIKTLIINTKHLGQFSSNFSEHNVGTCSEKCGLQDCRTVEENSFKSLLYQISGKFCNVAFKKFKNNKLYSRGTNRYEMTVMPVNTNLLEIPDWHTFYVTQVFAKRPIGRFLLALRYLQFQLVEMRRFYFLPDVNLTDRGAFKKLSWKSMDATKHNQCNGFIHLMYSKDVGLTGLLKNCDTNQDGPRHFYFKIACSQITDYDGFGGNHTEYTRNVKERFKFPDGWSVNPC